MYLCGPQSLVYSRNDKEHTRAHTQFQIQHTSFYSVIGLLIHIKFHSFHNVASSVSSESSDQPLRILQHRKGKIFGIFIVKRVLNLKSNMFLIIKTQTQLVRERNSNYLYSIQVVISYLCISLAHHQMVGSDHLVYSLCQ